MQSGRGSLVSVVCSQVEVSASGRSVGPTECRCVSVCDLEPSAKRRRCPRRAVAPMTTKMIIYASLC